jgi:hypothetical protein
MFVNFDMLRAATGIGHVIVEALLIQLSEKRGTSPVLIDIGNVPCLSSVSLTPYAAEQLHKCANSNRNAANSQYNI